MIIGICGVASSGKSTAGDALLASGYKRGKFANGLKEMMRALLRYRGVEEDQIERYVEGDFKELPSYFLNDNSPRHVMQTLGAWGRNDIDNDFWVDTEFDTWDGKNLFFDDLRHPNEESAIVARGGVIIHLVGRGGISGEHISESFKPKNAFMISNDGTIEDLQAKIDRFALDLSWVDNEREYQGIAA